VRKYYAIGYDLTELGWAEVQDKTKTRRELREIRERMIEFETRAANEIKKLVDFKFPDFEKQFFRSEQADVKEQLLKSDVTHAFTKYIASLKAEGREGTAASYDNAITSLTAYKKKLKFEDITPDFLKGYEKKMILSGKSITTVGIYLRSFRAIINQAISDGVMRQDQYPFGKRKYQPPGGVNIKKALTLAEIEKIFSYNAMPGSEEDKARDFWLFSYLCNGINIKDICLLRWKDINSENITFIRAKTSHTLKSNLRPIVAVLIEPALRVIHKWSQEKNGTDTFVFPILRPGLTLERERTLIKYFTKFINRWMRKIAEKLGIDKDITTYFARHSFATVLKRSGAPIEFISESLGHSDMSTTHSYLDSFEDDTKREYAKALLNFNR
jgi:integrase/recombinase XerD